MESEQSKGLESPNFADDRQMLIQVRDTLYEGSWEDFVRDLKARLEGRPYVFEIDPPSPSLKATIETHLRLIEELKTWERTHGKTLKADP